MAAITVHNLSRTRLVPARLHSRFTQAVAPLQLE